MREGKIGIGNLRTGYLVDGLWVYEDTEGHVLEERVLYRITRRSPDPEDVLERIVFLEDRQGKELGVKLIDLLERRFESPSGPVYVQQVVTPKQVLRQRAMNLGRSS